MDRAARDQLDAIAAMPACDAVTLPGRFYTDPAIWQAERETVLDHGWHCLGRVDEIPDPGDFLTATILHEPVIAVRGTDAVIRVLSNVCRHRGMRLAEGRGTARRFLCPYHAWAYRLDGALLRAPHMQAQAMDQTACALPSFRTFQWNGFLYATLSDTTPPPDLQGLDTLIGAYEPADYQIVHRARETWQTNWKCLVENFMEGYHLSVVHPQTLRGYTPTELSRKAASGAAYTSYIAHYPQTIAPRGQGAPGLSPEQRHASTLFAMFPGQVASISANLLVSLMLRPTAVDRTEVEWTMSMHPNDRANALIAQRIALWEEVNREDREKLEILQANLASRHAHAGPLAPPDFEGTIHDFHRYLAVACRSATCPKPADSC